MHTLFDFKLVRVTIGVAVVWIGFLVSLTLGDYLTRGWLLPSGK
jgi:hypothetical protein